MNLYEHFITVVSDHGRVTIHTMVLKHVGAGFSVGHKCALNDTSRLLSMQRTSVENKGRSELENPTYAVYE